MSGQAVSPTALSKVSWCFNSLQPCGEHYGVHHSCVPLEQKQETLAIGSSPELMKSGFLGTDIHFFFFFFSWIKQRRIPRSREREPQCWPYQRLLKWYRRGLPRSRKTQKNAFIIRVIQYCTAKWSFGRWVNEKLYFLPSSLPPSLLSLPSLPLPSFSFFF